MWAVAWDVERCAMWNEVECGPWHGMERCAMWNEVECGLCGTARYVVMEVVVIWRWWYVVSGEM